jgi:hypothetical protein
MGGVQSPAFFYRRRRAMNSEICIDGHNLKYLSLINIFAGPSASGKSRALRYILQSGTGEPASDKPRKAYEVDQRRLVTVADEALEFMRRNYDNGINHLQMFESSYGIEITASVDAGSLRGNFSLCSGHRSAVSIISQVAHAAYDGFDVCVIGDIDAFIGPDLIAEVVKAVYDIALKQSMQVFVSACGKETIDAVVELSNQPSENEPDSHSYFSYYGFVPMRKGGLADGQEFKIRMFKGYNFSRLVAAGNVDLRKCS